MTKWAQPGDDPNRIWILRFSDPDMREMMWDGDDAEREAICAWQKYSPTYNCYLFATIPLKDTKAKEFYVLRNQHGEYLMRDKDLRGRTIYAFVSEPYDIVSCSGGGLFKTFMRAFEEAHKYVDVKSKVNYNMNILEIVRVSEFKKNFTIEEVYQEKYKTILGGND